MMSTNYNDSLRRLLSNFLSSNYIYVLHKDLHRFLDRSGAWADIGQGHHLFLYSKLLGCQGEGGSPPWQYAHSWKRWKDAWLLL